MPADMLAKRLLSAAVGIPILIVVVLAGGFWYDGALGLALGAATAEFLLSARYSARDPLLWLAAMLAGELALSFRLGVAAPAGLLLAFLILFLTGIPMSERDRPGGPSRLLMLAIAVYVGWLGLYLGLLRDLNRGRSWVLLALFTTFAVDTGAYAIGRMFGRHKLAPRVSAGKTIEGAIAGLVSGMIAAVLLNQLLGPRESPALMTGVGLLIGIVAQCGDLAESALKRMLDVKDAGRLVPGHGGLLDRLDSLLFAGAVLYWIVRWLMQ